MKPRAMALGTGLTLSFGWTPREPLAGYSGTLYKIALLWLVIDDEAEQLNEYSGRRAPELLT